MCTKFSTCCFSMQLCNGSLCTSQPVNQAAAYSSSAEICCHACGLCMLWLLLIAAHNTPFCLSNGRLRFRLPCACGTPVLPWCDSEQIVVMQHLIMYLCVYVCMCTMCKCSTCCFSMQLCTTPLCASQPVKPAALYSSSANICSLWFTFVVYACCGCLSLEIISHLSASQMVGLALDYHVPAEPPSFHGVQPKHFVHYYIRPSSPQDIYWFHLNAAPKSYFNTVR